MDSWYSILDCESCANAWIRKCVVTQVIPFDVIQYSSIGFIKSDGITTFRVLFDILPLFKV